MPKYRIVLASSKTTKNWFIRELYPEIFWVERLEPVKRGLFRTQVSMEWVRVDYRLSQYSAECYIQELKEPIVEKPPRVVWEE